MLVNLERLKNRIEQINQISQDASGGYTRLAFTKTETRARQMVKRMMHEAGLEVHVDAVGNIFGRLYPENGKNACLKDVIATGSHIDTVCNGGKFDGLLGSIAGIEVAQCVKENRLDLKRPLEVIIFADEEGARFNAGMIGSKTVAGLAMEQPLEKYIDKDGKNLYDAMTECEYHPDKLTEAYAPKGRYKSFIELHIEQGIVLEQERKQIGIVTGIKGPYWIKGFFEGESNHAGGTPMNMRKDALVAAANFAAEVERIASGIGDMFVATIGNFRVYPGGINTIPCRVEYTIDIRDTDMERRKGGVVRIVEAAEKCAVKFCVKNHQECMKDSRSEVMSTQIIDVIENMCRRRNYSYMKLPSGPFHDTLSMTQVCDTGMIFVPSIGGISHSPYEDTAWEDIQAGAQILLDTIVGLLE